MRTLSNAARNALAASITTLTWCWRITRRDGVVQGFTRLDRDLVLDGVTYRAAVGIDPTAIAQTNNLNVNNLQLQSVLSDRGIREADLVGGLYDYAEVSIFLIDWMTLSDPIPLVSGTIGEFATDGLGYQAECRGLTQALAQSQSQVTSKTCRYSFGDSKCGMDLIRYTYDFTVDDTFNPHTIVVTSMAGVADGVFNFGQLTWTSGQNRGQDCAIASYSRGRFGLFEDAPYPIEPGDTFTAVAGCGHTPRDCAAFGNSANFGGETYVPGAQTFLSPL
jgi:uncharacterized phage protein (TIGR02218 family)